MKRSFAVSVLIHVAFLTLLLAGFRRSHPLTVPLTRSTVWIVDSGQYPKSVGSHGGKRSFHFQKQNLGIAGPSGGRGKGHEASQGDGYDVANGMGLAQEGKLYPFFEAIWHHVDTITTYPKDFVDQNIHGKVTVQLEVDHRGVFTGDIRSVGGEEPMLNTLAVASLVHALREPLPPNQWMKESRIMLVFQFDFNLVGYGEIPRELEIPHFKNVLSFKKSGHLEPVVNRVIEKVFTRYLPPIIPIPGGFFIDFPRAFLYVKNLVHPEPDEDELRQKRLEMKKEEMERFIQKKEY